MNIETFRLKQYNSTYKHLLMINGEPICLFESRNRTTEAIKYIHGLEADINDGRIKKILDKYRLLLANDIIKKVS